MFINQQQTKGMKLTANPAWLSLPPNLGKGSGAKFLRIMKLTTIIILAACLHTSAKGVAQQTITFSGKEVSLESVFTAIKKQTNYRFFFNTDMLINASKVTLEVKNAQIEQVMNMALKDQPLTFTIKGRTIFVMRKPEEEKKSTHVERTGDPITVSGRVTDENGEPLAGANVKVKGSNNGITTDGQGRFTLSNVDPNASLEVSFVGRETEILSVKGKTVFSVALGQRQSILDETVVIAYGTTSRRLATGNVSSVKAIDIEKQPVNNPLLALQGRVPGLFITQSSGLPGSGVTVRIQGQNSINKGNDPLYIIDGIPYTSQLLPTLNGILGGSGGPVINNVSSGSGNPLSFINPGDIESIDILKDADATAIYGSRAANGAILITTKKGKAGQTKVNINVQNGWGKVTRKLELLNTQQYLQMRNEAHENENEPVEFYEADMNGVWDTTRNTDWQKELIGGTAKYTDVQASVSGGNSNTQFLIGAGYHRETTVFPGDLEDQKGSLHFNINNASLNQRFRFQLSGNYLIDNNVLQAADLTNTAIRLSPNAPSIYNTDGSLNWAQIDFFGSPLSLWDNPLSYLLNKYKNKTSNLIGNAQISYNVFPGLEIKGNLGYTNLQSNEFQGGSLLAVRPEDRANTLRSASYGNSTISTWIVEPQLSYKRSLGKGNLDVMLGTTIQHNNSALKQLNAQGYNSDLVLEDIKAATTITVGNTINSSYKYNAVFGRINYNWQDKYIVNITARRDGSSRFGSENLFHSFGSIGGAWIFSKENFIQKNIPFISFGKLRGSFGTTGNDQIGDYQFMNLYGNVPNVGVPYGGIAGLQPTGLPNPYLEWEETKKMQFGLELGLFSDRVVFNVNYFHNRSSNQLLAYNLPRVTGFSSISAYNFPATIQNTGWEFSLNSSNIKKADIRWSTSINLSFSKNKLVEFPGIATSAYANTYVVGESIMSTKVYHSLGVNSTTGLYQFSDKNGNTTSSPSFSEDRTVLINAAPKYYGGFGNNIQYKGFELDVLFQFVKQIGPNYLFGLLPGQNFTNQPTSILSRWKKSGDNSSVQRYSTYNTSDPTVAFTAFTSSDAAWSDASYIRLKNLSVSWQIPAAWRRNIHLQNCRLFVQGQNLLTITNYMGLDPENRSVSSLPPLRILTLGVQLTL